MSAFLGFESYLVDAGATVYVASWLVKINTGLHQAGFVKPTN